MYGYLKGSIVSLALLLSMVVTPYSGDLAANSAGSDRAMEELARARSFHFHYGRPYYRGRYYRHGRRPGYYRYRRYPRRYYRYGYPRYRHRSYYYRDPYYYRGPRAGVYFGW